MYKPLYNDNSPSYIMVYTIIYNGANHYIYSNPDSYAIATTAHGAPGAIAIATAMIIAIAIVRAIAIAIAIATVIIIAIVIVIAVVIVAGSHGAL
jgi:hypothetical protein